MSSPADNTKQGVSVALSCSAAGDLDNDTVYYQFLGDTSNPPTTALQNSTDTSFTWSGLTRGTTYYWRCRTYDNESWGAYTGARSFAVNVLATLSGVRNASLNVSRVDPATGQPQSLIPGTTTPSTAIYKRDQLVGFAENYSDADRDFEANSTFKWYINNTNQSWGGGNRTAEMVAMIYKGALGYWHLDNDVKDSSGTGNDGSLIGSVNATNVSGMIGKAINFTQVSYVEVPNSATTRGLKNLTISAWVMPFYSSGTSAIRYILYKCTGNQACGPADASNTDYTLYLSGGNTIAFRPNTGILTTNDTISNGTWHHLVVTEDSSGNARIYINGEFKISEAGFSVGGANASKLRIGNGKDGELNNFFGSIDEVAIYNKTLTAAEVKQLYLRTWYDHSPQQFLLHPNYPEEVDNSTQNTTLLLHFDEGTGANVTDSSPYGNNGKITGAFFTNDSISGSALSFGTNDNVTIAASPTLSPDKAITVMAWLKLSSWSDSRVLALADDVSDLDGYVLRTDVPSDSIFFSVGNGTKRDSSAVFPIDVNKWMHIAGTYNGSLIRIFKNGVENGSGTAHLENITYTPNILFAIGKAYDANGVTGIIDEVKIVNRSLTAAEISADYRKGVRFGSSDGEAPTSESGVVWQPGRYVENLSLSAPYANTTAYLRLDDGSGTTATDLSGSGNSGSFQGAANNASWTNDSVSGYALKFDGVDDFVKIPLSASLNATWNGSNGFTVSAWLKRGNISTGNYPIIKESTGASGDWWISTGGNWICNSGGGSGTASTGVRVINGEWHFITLTYNTTLLSCFLDGVLYATDTTPGSMSRSNTSVFLGAWGSGDGVNAGGYWNGTVDELRIVNRTLSAAEILADYRKAAKGLGLLSNDYINYSATGNFNEREGTVEFWVKPEWNGNEQFARTFVVLEKSNNDFRLGTLVNTNDLVVMATDTVMVRKNIGDWLIGNWRHVGVVWNNYTSNISLFIDGLQVNNSRSAFSISPQSDLSIGSENGNSINFCNCTISEFRISRKALSAQEINESFSKGRQYFSNEIFLNNSNFNKWDSFKLGYRQRSQQQLPDC
ncbi:hypothetical protein HYV83_02530 [Candidatus Woesearchaeota archaeon]|nr:hypothetical protein [Candidatus Woesearchaeota archaeon]